MTATDHAALEAAAQLDDAEFNAALARLRKYREQLEQAGQQADEGTLECAANLTKVFEDRRWVDQLPTPKKAHHRGRPIDPASRSRFAKWVKAEIDLSPSYCYRLLNADQLQRILSPKAKESISGETALRPLSKLIKQNRLAEAPVVWQRAEELADGEAPTVTHARKALADHDKATGRTPATKRQGYAQRTIRESRKKAVDYFDYVLQHGSKEDIQELLAELDQRYTEFEQYRLGKDAS
ncbi:MAG: hypothetical protein GEU78_17075 [Actinobacteria bacterium]|nr:hypothetical protein [Actinomycetota bacterium]